MPERCFLLLIGAFLMAPAAATAQQKLPAGVTQDMITEGGPIFKGAGLCTVCHGPDGKGMQGLGPDLTDSEWIHHKGTYEELVTQIMVGIPADKSTTGLVMPPKGGSQITDDQVKAVAAYVWSISHK